MPGTIFLCGMFSKEKSLNHAIVETPEKRIEANPYTPHYQYISNSLMNSQALSIIYKESEDVYERNQIIYMRNKRQALNY